MTTPTTSTRAPRRFVYKPIMYAWVGRKKGGSVIFYSFELRNTLSQIANRVEFPRLDFDYGYQSLINLIEEKMKGQYNVARIYGCPTKDKPSILLREYRNDAIAVENDKDLDFSSPTWKEWSEKIAKRISEAIYHADEVYHITNLKRNLKAVR